MVVEKILLLSLENNILDFALRVYRSLLLSAHFVVGWEHEKFCDLMPLLTPTTSYKRWC